MSGFCRNQCVILFSRFSGEAELREGKIRRVGRSVEELKPVPFLRQTHLKEKKGSHRGSSLRCQIQLFFFVLFFLTDCVHSAENLVFYSDTQAKPIPITIVGGKRFVPLMDLLSSLGKTNVVEKTSTVLQVKVDRHTLFIRPNSTLVVVDGALNSLGEPVLIMSSGWMVPAEFINKIFPRLTDRKVIFRNEASRVFLTAQPPARVFFEATRGIISSRVAVEVTQAVPFELKRDGKQLTLLLGSHPLDAAMEKLTHSDELIKSVAFDDSDFKPKIRILLSSATVDIQTSITQEGKVFVLAVSPPQQAPAGSVKTQTPSARLPAGTKRPETSAPLTGGGLIIQPPRGVLRTVTLDVGHGGIDTGARSVYNHVQEKTLTLEIAQRLRLILQRRLGLQVVLTRENDVDVSLDQRAIVANTSHSDIFLSLHFGFSLIPNPGAPSVYVNAPVKESSSLPTGKSTMPSAEAHQESPSSNPSATHVYFRDWSRANDVNFQLNLTLAEVLESELSPLWNREPSPPCIAALKPLANVFMPAVMVELGNLNSEADVKQLQTPQFQTSIVSAIANALERFKPIYEGQTKNAETH